MFSYAGISAAWTSRDGDDPKLTLSVAEAAAPDLNQ
jgi:streptomycin 6-kinase